jgi:superfamily II DNA or RNA helicase
MTSFRELDLRHSYDSGIGNSRIIEQFYLPVLENSVGYDRVAGYFSSRVLASSARGIAGLIRREGKMRLVTSHAFTPNDAITMQQFFESEDFSNQLISEFKSDYLNLGNLTNTITQNHVAAMCWMLREGYLEIKVVVPTKADLTKLTVDEIDKFHPKFGIFSDGSGDLIAFSGSINETQSAWIRNIENFDVYKSWEDGDSKFIKPKIATFENYWEGQLDGNWRTIDLPKAVKDRIIEDFAPDDFPSESELGIKRRRPGLRAYQDDAITAWEENGRRGLLEMATGTGKTKTSKACIKSSMLEGSLLTVVIVPYKHIGSQWILELAEFEPVLIEGDWRAKLTEIKSDAIMGRIDNLVLVVVKNTASSDDFTKAISDLRGKFNHYLLVGDEVHWLGANYFRNALMDSADYRLGLSATPQRYFDDEGSDFLIEYFDRVVYKLSISVALKLRDDEGQRILCDYEYLPKFVDLDSEEFAEYQKYTQKIIKLKNSDDFPEKESQLSNLYINRANIIKGAKNKIPALRQLLESFDELPEQCLIYCSDFKQLEEADKVLSEFGIHAQKITGLESTSASAAFNNVSQRDFIINNFSKGHLGVLLAIDCLDEGVDIPTARIGIILASSGNPKEFIQRRGRLIRPYPGKDKAIIYDFCVLPENDDSVVSNIGAVKSELNRIREFAADALNKDQVEEMISHVDKENSTHE